MLVLSDGLKVNGSELARGLRENLPAGVAVTGGLAGDGTDFQQTLVCADSNAVRRGDCRAGFLRRPPQGRLWFTRRLGFFWCRSA